MVIIWWIHTNLLEFFVSRKWVFNNKLILLQSCLIIHYNWLFFYFFTLIFYESAVFYAFLRTHTNNTIRKLRSWSFVNNCFSFIHQISQLFTLLGKSYTLLLLTSIYMNRLMHLINRIKVISHKQSILTAIKLQLLQCLIKR